MITVVVLRSGGRDAHGDPLPGSEHEVPGCLPPAPRTAGGGRSSSEDDNRGETVIVGLTLYAPFDADIEATDQVRIDEPAWKGTYDVVGKPGRWQSPYTGRRPGMEVALTRTT